MTATQQSPKGEDIDAVMEGTQEAIPATVQESVCFSSLPDELIMYTTSFLGVASLLSLRRVNKAFADLGSRNDAGWSERCQELWKNKVFVCSLAKIQAQHMMSYKLSLQDAQERQHLSLEELCYDEIERCGTIWSFRFKVSAGPDWTSWDPWWMGRHARQMVFLRNGTVRQYVPQSGNTDVLKSPSLGILVDPPAVMVWRFICQPMDLPKRPEGSYLRFSVGGRDVPTYVVKRSPTNNWGFIAESCWGIYTSFRMPKRVKQGRRSRASMRRIHCARDLRSEGVEDIAVSLFNDDSIFTITNEVQWREALLYNFGAGNLPDGEDANDDFDRMFGQQPL